VEGAPGPSSDLATNGRSLRRRLILTVVLLTVGTLLVTGVVTLLLTVHTARQQTRREVAGEAISLAHAVRTDAADPQGELRAARLRRVLALLKRPLHLDGSAVVTITATGALPAPLPGGLRPSAIDVTRVRSGLTASGTQGNLVFAAAPLFPVQDATTAVAAREVLILVRRAPTGLGTALPWLVVSSAGVLLAAILVADRLVRRIVRPLRTAETVTARIAGGDLSARVDDDRPKDPELRHLGVSINTMAEALAAAQRTQRQFLLSVSHELRTPLTSIQGWAEALEDGTATDVPRAAGIIGHESRRLDRLVRDLLELARLDTGHFTLRPTAVHLSAVVTDTVSAFAPAATELGLSLHAAVDGASADVLADPDRLIQVLSNLIENALNYAAETVVVGAATAAGGAVIWVDDDGPGVAADDVPHIFTRLFSSTERQGRRVGSGLGLAIVAELVTSMGGHVRAESPLGPGGGTRVVVTLQLAP
jgi:signal transduction histidine kinase